MSRNYRDVLDGDTNVAMLRIGQSVPPPEQVEPADGGDVEKVS